MADNRPCPRCGKERSLKAVSIQQPNGGATYEAEMCTSCATETKSAAALADEGATKRARKLAKE